MSVEPKLDFSRGYFRVAAFIIFDTIKADFA